MFHFMVVERASTSEAEAGENRLFLTRMQVLKNGQKSLRRVKKPQIQKKHRRMFSTFPPKSKSPLYSSLLLRFLSWINSNAPSYMAMNYANIKVNGCPTFSLHLAIPRTTSLQHYTSRIYLRPHTRAAILKSTPTTVDSKSRKPTWSSSSEWCPYLGH